MIKILKSAKGQFKRQRRGQELRTAALCCLPVKLNIDWNYYPINFFFFSDQTHLLTNFAVSSDLPDAAEWAGQKYRTLQRRGQLKDRHHVFH